MFKEPQIPAFRHYFEELKAADTIPKVFMVLNDYFSFFNYHIIEHIIKALGTEEDKADLQRYKKDFNQYAKRRIFECLPEFGPVSDADHADIIVKLDSQYDNYTVAQIGGFCHKLSDILHLSSHGILRHCQVDKGCFQLMFQVPLFVQQKIFPLSRKQEKALAGVGVIRLTCGEYQFLVKLSVLIVCGMRFGRNEIVTAVCCPTMHFACCIMDDGGGVNELLLFSYRKMNYHEHKLVCSIF